MFGRRKEEAIKPKIWEAEKEALSFYITHTTRLRIPHFFKESYKGIFKEDEIDKACRRARYKAKKYFEEKQATMFEEMILDKRDGLDLQQILHDLYPKVGSKKLKKAINMTDHAL